MPRLIKRTIEASAPRATRYEIWDDKLTGFGLRVSPTGVRTFVVIYRNASGDQRRHTIGQYGPALTAEVARERATEALRIASDGGDPAAVKRANREAPRMGELADEYEKQRVPAMKDTTQRTEKHLLAKHVRPRFDKRTVASITRGDIEAVKRDMRATPGAANKVIGILSRLFAFAEEIEWRPAGSNPARGVAKNPERKVERYLTADERARLERALTVAARSTIKTRGHVDASAVACFRLLALTGMRLGEALDLQWRDVDIEHRRLVLPTSKTGAKIVRLSSQAVALLESLPDEHKRVFATETGERLANMQRRWIIIRKAAALPGLRIHDLRHAWASDAVMAGVPLHVVGKQLGHASPTTTNRYAHLSGDVLAEAVERVGGVIDTNTRKGDAGKVVAIAAKRRRKGAK